MRLQFWYALSLSGGIREEREGARTARDSAKDLGHLVRVGSTCRHAYTSRLSTR
jgi:hypothetical protein